MKIFILTGITILCILLFFSFPLLHLTVQADFLMIWIVALALLGGPVTATVIGFIGGLIVDVLYGDAYCLFAFIYMSVGFLVAITIRYDDQFFKRYILPFILAGVCVMYREIVVLVYILMKTWTLPNILDWFWNSLQCGLLTLVIMPFVFPIVRKLYGTEVMRKPLIVVSNARKLYK